MDKEEYERSDTFHVELDSPIWAKKLSGESGPLPPQPHPTFPGSPHRPCEETAYEAMSPGGP